MFICFDQVNGISIFIASNIYYLCTASTLEALHLAVGKYVVCFIIYLLAVSLAFSGVCWNSRDVRDVPSADSPRSSPTPL